jgi:hypothetical protein|tara:strand:- start:3431 stop:3655 length:225 start_codon:yes stop_codon:yes gene_type:complete
MKVISKITGRDVTSEYGGLMEGLITNDEFEVVACISPQEGINVIKKWTSEKEDKIEDTPIACSAEQDWEWHYSE